MLDKVKKFYAQEYKDTLNWLSCEYCNTKENKIKSINNAIQRCLAIALFVQNCGVAFEEVDVLYDEYRTKFQELLHKAESIR